MKKKINFMFILILLGALKATATKHFDIEKNRHEATQDEYLQAMQNSVIRKVNSHKNKSVNQTIAWRPAEDTADFKYVLMSAETGFSEVTQLRYTIAKNLPKNVKLILLVDQSEVTKIRKAYSSYIESDRLILATTKDSSGGFWARDAFPYPIVDQQGQVSLVSAKYYRPFNAGDAIALSINKKMTKESYTFVGGNLIANKKGVCFTVDSYRKFSTTEDDLYSVYGCREVHYLKHYAGIGDVDEVVKPLDDQTILTNTKQYVADFEKWGYKVVMLPDVPNSYRTYVNALVVGKIVFMPAYGISQDQEAQRIYESLGYTVYPIRSNYLSDNMHGSVHCQTMAYPDMDQNQLMKDLNLTELH